MSVIEELLNLVITFAIVMAPLWILISRRRRMQQEQQQRKQQQRPPGKQPVPQPTDRYGREMEPRTQDGREAADVAAGRDYPVRGREDESYTAEQRGRARMKEERHDRTESPDARSAEKPAGRLEKMLRELLGIPDEEERVRREREASRRSAKRPSRKRSAAERRRAEQQAEQAKPVPDVPRHADVTIRAVIHESASLTLSSGGMGPQHMRTAAGNLGAASTADVRPPAKESLGGGWTRVSRLPDFKRAVLFAELLGKPHALKDRDEF